MESPPTGRAPLRKGATSHRATTPCIRVGRYQGGVHRLSSRPTLLSSKWRTWGHYVPGGGRERLLGISVFCEIQGWGAQVKLGVPVGSCLRAQLRGKMRSPLALKASGVPNSAAHQGLSTPSREGTLSCSVLLAKSLSQPTLLAARSSAGWHGYRSRIK